jgi:hypothetical protein
VHGPLRVHLQIHGHVITGAEVSFRAPYPVTRYDQDYYVWGRNCHGRSGLSSLNANVARGATLHIQIGQLFSEACGRSLKIEVQYAQAVNGPVEPSVVGTMTIREPPGTHAPPLPGRSRSHRG